MTAIDRGRIEQGKTVSIEAFCPLTTSAATTHPDTPAALTADGAYTEDVLRIVRGTPNAEELAALVAALLLTRRAHDHSVDSSGGTSHEDNHHRPGWLRDRYTAPGSWTAGP